MSPGAGTFAEPTSERERLVMAFVEAVAEDGEAEVEVGEICVRAGLSAESFARHFPDRCACWEAAWDRLELAFFGRLEVVIEGQGGWRDQLRAGLTETARLIDDYPGPARFLTVATLNAGERERQRQRQLADRLAEALDSARGQLPDPTAVPERTSRWVLAMLFDRIYRHLATEQGQSLSAQLPQLMFLAVSAYFGAEAGLMELHITPP